MKILVTGANGLLGNKLVELCLMKGDELIATSLGESRLSQTGSFVYEQLNITDREQVDRVLNRYEPEVVINTAAMTQVDDCETQQDKCWKINVEAVSNLVHASEKTGSFFIQLSTDFIFDGSEGPLDETAEPNPVNYYGESKLAAENIVKDSKLEWAIARTVLVYGISPGMSRSNIILWVKEKLEKGEEIRVVNDQFRTPTLAEDLALGCYLIAQRRARGIFNISGSDFLTPYQMAVQTADFFGLDKSLIHETDSKTFTQPARRPLITGFKIDKAKEELWYQPQSFIEGVAVVAELIK